MATLARHCRAYNEAVGTGTAGYDDGERERPRRLRVLFFVHNLGKTRHFDGVLQRLAKRGHTVVLATAAKHSGVKSAKIANTAGRIETVGCPVRRVDRWRKLAPTLRLVRDYLRFFEPAYSNAGKLSERAASYAPDTWRAMIERRPWMQRHARLIGRILALAEAALPPDRYFELFIKYHEPDLVMVTPLVNFGSYQTDYVKAAHRLGIPVAFIPFSWDNLTNRGLIRVQPDRIIVWNDIQKREAVELHGMSPASVVVTGAARFDDFFDLEVSTPREAFCASVGLDPTRPVLLYGCSSPFVAPEEVAFVRRWIQEVRASSDPLLAGAGILVRPHPAHADQWEGVTFDDSPNVAIWRLPMSMNSDQGLYDSLYHAAALAGLNTSAMLEASIVGRPVLTVLSPDFGGGQSQTLHFQYLRQENGGPVAVAKDFAEHRQQLENVLHHPEKAIKRASKFASRFIRPNGPYRRVDTFVVHELEQTALMRKRPRLPSPWQYPVRWALAIAPGARAPRALSR